MPLTNERARALIEGLRKEAECQDNEWPEPDDFCPARGGDGSRSVADTIEALVAERITLLAENERLRAALIEVEAVENLGEQLRKKEPTFVSPSRDYYAEELREEYDKRHPLARSAARAALKGVEG